MRKAYVLTIPRLKKRQEEFEDAWGGSLSYEFVEGYDYKDLNAVWGGYEELLLPHAAAFAGTMRLWSDLLKTKENEWLIMEDDARPTNWFQFDFERLEEFDYTCVKFFHVFPDTPPVGIHRLKKKGYVGTAAYMITREGILELWEKQGVMGIDQFITMSSRCYAPYPCLVEPQSNVLSYTPRKELPLMKLHTRER